MIATFRVLVLLDNQHTAAPLVRAMTPIHAKARAVGMEIGRHIVVRAIEAERIRETKGRKA